MSSEATVRVFIPANDIDLIGLVASLQRAGFLPRDAFEHSVDVRGYELRLDGELVRHFLELVEIATQSRHAETVPEWLDGRSRQLELID